MTETRLAKVRAIMGRAGWQRTAPHTATVGTVTGRGTSQQAALDDLATQLTEAATRDSGAGPVLAWDADNGALWIAIPDVMHGGAREYMVPFRDGAPRHVRHTGCRDDADGLADCVGFDVVPIA